MRLSVSSALITDMKKKEPPDTLCVCRRIESSN